MKSTSTVPGFTGRHLFGEIAGQPQRRVERANQRKQHAGAQIARCHHFPQALDDRLRLGLIEEPGSPR